MSDELKMAPFSVTLKTLIQKYFTDAEQLARAAIEQDAIERQFAPGTQFDLRQLCWMMPAEKKEAE